jgi:hypothetical protein
LQIDFSQVIKDRRGAPIYEGPDRPLTLGAVAVMAIDAPAPPAGQPTSVLDKRRLDKLADRILDAGYVEINDAEWLLLRDRIGAAIEHVRVCSAALGLLEEGRRAGHSVEERPV